MGGGLIQELKKNGILERISSAGFRSDLRNVLMYEGLYEEGAFQSRLQWSDKDKAQQLLKEKERYDKEVAKMTVNLRIIEKYNSYCPEGFEVDVSNYNFPPRHEQYVTCERKDGYDSCKKGYVKSYHKVAWAKEDNIDGIFGCVKLASCKETNPKYEEGAKEGFDCPYCEAGGCVDGEKSHELPVGVLCRVNDRDPEKTPPCAPY